MQANPLTFDALRQTVRSRFVTRYSDMKVKTGQLAAPKRPNPTATPQNAPMSCENLRGLLQQGQKELLEDRDKLRRSVEVGPEELRFRVR
jgi:hypothetical protein